MTRYFLFGYYPVADYNDDIDATEININDGMVFMFDPVEQNVTELLDAFDGWSAYAEISESEYNILSERYEIQKQ